MEMIEQPLFDEEDTPFSPYTLAETVYVSNLVNYYPWKLWDDANYILYTEKETPDQYDPMYKLDETEGTLVKFAAIGGVGDTLLVYDLNDSMIGEFVKDTAHDPLPYPGDPVKLDGVIREMQGNLISLNEDLTKLGNLDLLFDIEKVSNTTHRESVQADLSKYREIMVMIYWTDGNNKTMIASNRCPISLLTNPTTWIQTDDVTDGLDSRLSASISSTNAITIDIICKHGSRHFVVYGVE